MTHWSYVMILCLKGQLQCNFFTHVYVMAMFQFA